jgi:hypothetical protein
MTPNTLMRYTAPDGSQFEVIILTGRVDLIFGTVTVKRDDDGRLVHAEPRYLEPINEA